MLPTRVACVASLLLSGAVAFEVPTLEKTVTSQSPGTGSMSVYRMHTGPHDCINTADPTEDEDHGFFSIIILYLSQFSNNK